MYNGQYFNTDLFGTHEFNNQYWSWGNVTSQNNVYVVAPAVNGYYANNYFGTQEFSPSYWSPGTIYSIVPSSVSQPVYTLYITLRSNYPNFVLRV